ncbi:TPA: UDP-N-acetylmuramoyl-L-alanine--D-glutamate ligase [Candidatus Sumerlaeota bacterium]|nr:UDP-N-acetylmuramoyl-L-alanine--D-glutamate ligase [Candidatus Sumerlaeota bacterium]
MENYATAKVRITRNQQSDDTLVLSADDAFCREMAKATRAQVLWISTKGLVEQGAYLADGNINLVMKKGETSICVMPRADIPLPGLHNVENVLACIAMSASLGVATEQIAAAVRTFQAVPHRIEWIAKIDGVDYYNDSKATNLDSVEKALTSFDRPVLLIAGGRDKGAPWTQLNDLVAKHVKGLALIGEAAEIGRAAWGGIVPRVEMASGMEDAVRRCRAMANEGDVVLLSPACASFDMYKNFEERGEHFRKIVETMR